MKKLAPKSITISKAKIADAQTIRKLEEKVRKEEVVNKYDAPMFIRFGYAYIAKHGKKIIGAIVAYPTKDNEIYICDRVVESTYRGQKIGQKLYQRLIREVGRRTIVSFIDPKNSPSLKGHIKLGFKVIKKVQNAYMLNEGPRLFVKRIPTKKAKK